LLAHLREVRRYAARPVPVVDDDVALSGLVQVGTHEDFEAVAARRVGRGVHLDSDFQVEKFGGVIDEWKRAAAIVIGVVVEGVRADVAVR